MEWARQHVEVLSQVKKDTALYLAGERQKNVYLVAKGMLGRIEISPDTGKRKILSVALPGMAMLTTPHLYSNTPSKGDITALRSGSTILRIPYAAIRDFKEKDPRIDTLIDVLVSKKIKQLSDLRIVTLSDTSFSRYEAFAKQMPYLKTKLTQQEQADLLGISRYTVQEVQHFLATGRKRKRKK